MLDNTGKKIKHQTKKQIKKSNSTYQKLSQRKLGLDPGSLIYVGDKEKQPISLKFLITKADHFIEKNVLER